ncbi:MAG TPA: hypothetical protein VII69_11035 [Candidatus Eremiobacteraceae bacterium]
MMKRFTAAVAATALVAISGAITMPAAASASSATQMSYTTTLMQVEPISAPGEFDGKLKLTVSSAGLVSGYYIPADSGQIMSVVGGVADSKYWMDIGGTAPLHIIASLGKDGSLVGTATPSPFSRSQRYEAAAETYSFVAKPQPAT